MVVCPVLIRLDERVDAPAEAGDSLARLFRLVEPLAESTVLHVSHEGLDLLFARDRVDEVCTSEQAVGELLLLSDPVEEGDDLLRSEVKDVVLHSFEVHLVVRLGRIGLDQYQLSVLVLRRFLRRFLRQLAGQNGPHQGEELRLGHGQHDAVATLVLRVADQHQVAAAVEAPHARLTCCTVHQPDCEIEVQFSRIHEASFLHSILVSHWVESTPS